MAKRKTSRQVVNSCNALARLFYAARGYQVPTGYRFDKCSHPEELGMWNLACIAYEHIEGTDPNDALSDLDE